MRNRQIFIFCGFIFFALNAAFAQQSIMKQYNRELPNILYTFIHRNPSEIDTSGKANFKVGYNGFSKLSENLNSYYFLANFRLSDNNNRIKHYLGAQVFNYQEGKYIRQYTAHFRYSQVVRLEKNTFLSTGISFGFFNNLVVANDVTGGSGSLSPDGTIGLKISRVRSSIGISASQLFKSRFTSFERPAELIRTYYAHLSHHFYLDPSETFHIEGAFILKSPDQFKTYTGWLSARIIYTEMLEMNVLFNDIQSYSVGVAFPKIKIGEQTLGFRVNYFAPFIDKNYTNFNNLEIGLSYVIH